MTADPDLAPITDQARLAAGMWTLFEPIHLLTYFTDQARQAFEDAGIRGFWRGYFAGRAAPLGRVGPAPVVALFFGFAPRMVARALPAVWDLAEPEAALAARRAGAAAALRSLMPDADAVARAAGALSGIARSVDPAGRALGAANAAQPRVDDAYAELWQAATTLREHRGDGHVAALVVAGLGGAESLVLRAGVDLERAVLQAARGWTDQEWDAARDRLVGRGLLDAAGVATDAGRALVRRIERQTDEAAVGPWTGTGVDVAALASQLLPIARACHAALPWANPIGLAPLWDPAGADGVPDRFGGRAG